MPTARYTVAVIGGGIVGLASARAWLARYPQTRLILLEKEDGTARHQTSHNSGVIHSGIYYRPGSLKAALCVRGAAMMLEFCRLNRIPYRISGKVIVATSPQELTGLERLYEQGKANGVPNLELIGPERLKEIEPCATGLRALRVPGAGVVDYAQVAQALAGSVASAGGHVRTGARVKRIIREAGNLRILLASGEEVLAETIINCAGLYADRLSRKSGADHDLQIVPFRGEYYAVVPERAGLVRSMIYPVPDALFPFLGAHFTRDIHGALHAGPNAVLALKREGYRKYDIDLRDAAEILAFPGLWKLLGHHWRYGLGELRRSFYKPAFVSALRRLVPEIRDADLVASPSGVRAQALDRKGALVDDFNLVYDRGMMHVRNVPSPAATASLAIAEVILDRIKPPAGGRAIASKF